MTRARGALGSALRRTGHRTSRLKLPRRSVQLRLTMLYGALFLVSGAGLLAITYVLIRALTGGSVSVVGPAQVAGRLSVGLEDLKDGAFLYRSAIGGGSTSSRGTSFSRIVMRSTPVKVVRATPINRATPVNKVLAVSPKFIKLSPTQARQVLDLQATQHGADLHELLVYSGVALVVMAIVSIGLGWLVAGRVLRPLRTITATARQVSATSLHERLALSGPDDELKELADTFDGLLARLESSFEAQRRFVANASHELRTPLARQRTLAEVALSDPEPTVESLRATVERLLAAGEEQEALTEALLTLARSDRGLEHRERFDLADLAESVTASRFLEIRRRGLRLESSLRPAPVSGEPVLFERLVGNLVDNALKYNVDGGEIVVSTRHESGHCRLRVANSGPAIPSEEVDRLLQPFQRLRPERTGHREGLGLGLSIVQAIAHAHGASLSVRARHGGGLEVDVRLVSAELADGRAATTWTGKANEPPEPPGPPELAVASGD